MPPWRGWGSQRPIRRRVRWCSMACGLPRRPWRPCWVPPGPRGCPKTTDAARALRFALRACEWFGMGSVVILADTTLLEHHPGCGTASWSRHRMPAFVQHRQQCRWGRVTDAITEWVGVVGVSLIAMNGWTSACEWGPLCHVHITYAGVNTRGRCSLNCVTKCVHTIQWHEHHRFPTHHKCPHASVNLTL